MTSRLVKTAILYLVLFIAVALVACTKAQTPTPRCPCRRGKFQTEQRSPPTTGAVPGKPGGSHSPRPVQPPSNQIVTVRGDGTVTVDRLC